MPPLATDEQRQRPMIGAMFRGPGPAYALPSLLGHSNHTLTKTLRPAYSFGTKSIVKGHEKSPGPAAYKVPPKITRNGGDGTPQYTLHYRTKSGSTLKTPGPGMGHL